MKRVKYISFLPIALLVCSCGPNYVEVPSSKTLEVSTSHEGIIRIRSGDEVDHIIIEKEEKNLVTIFLYDDSVEFTYHKENGENVTDIFDSDGDGISDKMTVRSLDGSDSTLFIGETTWKKKD